MILLTLAQAATFFCVRWALLPSMFARKHCLSALFVSNDNDDVAVLVIGGFYGTGKEAAILSCCSNQVSRDPETPWRWREIAPMQMRRRYCPGMILLRSDHVAVAGGEGIFAEILHLPHDDNDSGVWTRIRGPLIGHFFATSLVNFNNRILAFG